MIKDPERDESSIEYLGNQDTNEYSGMANIDPNSNHMVDSDNSGEISDPEVVNNILFATSTIPVNFKKSNVTVISNTLIPGVKTISDDIRYTKKISNYSRIIFNQSFKNVNDYELMISNFKKRAGSGSKLIVKKSDLDLSVRKISLDNNLKFSTEKDFSVIEQERDAFHNYEICGTVFSCICAETEKEKLDGLQVVDNLSEREGMVFPYDRERPLTFAMKSVSFPIDIIFCSNGVINKIYENIEPGDMGYYGGNADTVIEILGGTCSELGIKEGGSCFRTDKTPTTLAKLSSYDVYYLTDLISESESFVKMAGSNSIYSSKKAFSSSINYINSKKYFFSKKASYFEPLNNNFVLINNSDLDNANAKNLFSSAFPGANYKIIKSSSRNPDEIANAVMSAIDCYDCRIFDFSLEKEAAFPVPNSVKQSAIEVDKEIVKNIKRIKDIVTKLEKNKSIYEKNKDNIGAIKGSSGVFRQSMKRLSVNFKSIIYSVKVIIKSLNNIKDTTNVEEIVNSMLVTTQNLSKFFKQILDLQDKLDLMNFYSELEQKTNDFLKISEDLETVSGRARDFIWNHILGKSLLTD